MSPADRLRRSTVPDAAPPGSDLPLLLLLGFRAVIEDVYSELAAGDPILRPLHGMVLEAIGEGATAAALGRRLGVSKQAAAKTVAALERDGYVERVVDPADARTRIVRVTPRGCQARWRVSEALARQRQRWVDRLSTDLVDAMEEALRTMVTAEQPGRFEESRLLLGVGPSAAGPAAQG